jgi:hypothetical protein
MTVHQPGQERDAAGRSGAGPSGQRPRRRAYFVMMGICLVLIILAWMVVWHFSVLAAVIMSVVAVVIPPFAAIVANNGPMNRQ